NSLDAKEKHLLKATISLPSLLEVVLTRARIKETKGSLHDALADYNQCLEIIDSLQADFRAESQQILMGNAFAIYDGALEVLEQMHFQGNTEVLDQVLALMEGYKSLLLNEAFMRTHALEFAGVPSAVTRKEEAFKNRIGFLKQKIWDAQRAEDETGLAELQSKLFLEENNYDNFKAQLRTDYPKYYQLRYTRSSPTVKEVQDKILSDDQAMVEYFIGQNKLFALAISPLGEQLISVPYSKELAADLTSFYQLSSKRTVIADYEAEVRKYAETAYHLYQSLLLPLETVIQNHNLIIIPDGALHFITFSGLLTEPSDELNFAKLPYLIRKVNTSYYYSAGLLQTSLQAGNRKQPKSMLALTPEVRGPQEFDNLMAFREGDELGRIPGAYYEVVNIGELIGADFYTGSEVSESNFKRMANDYKVLHLAMHGVVDNQHPNFSRLVFNSENDTLNDGLLHTYELYNMKLNADLVVLSACNTGYGTLMKGEGLLSLGHSFAYAGCPNILMSKWPAADQPTNELMQYFYAQIKDGVPKDEALRQAKLQYLGTGDKITTHPVFWANFVLVGNNLPLELDRTSWISWLVLGAVLVVLFGVVLVRMRKRRRLVTTEGMS
ncbi:MAG: CHAT domain-containing protein, partial [Cyclobacteriaceae bacterium]|nr:CHAT domain-containing protein [Cyclobacteriaceae bacterium]